MAATVFSINAFWIYILKGVLSLYSTAVEDRLRRIVSATGFFLLDPFTVD